MFWSFRLFEIIIFTSIKLKSICNDYGETGRWFKFKVKLSVFG